MQSFLSGQRLALLVSALAVSLVVSAPLTALGQSESAAADGVGVARISLVQGSVNVQRGDAPDSLSAALNAPVLGGDYITTGDGAQAEVQFDGSSQLRLGQDAQVRFTHLDAGDRALQLAQGTLELRLLSTTDGNAEIDTPSVSIKPQSHGGYRVTVTADGQTLVTVRSGQAEIDTPQGPQNVGPGSTLEASGAAANPSIQTIAAIEPDDFDRFNAERDRLHDRALADAAFVNTDIGGVDELDAYGHWVPDGSYGHVWVPASIGPDWAPYRDGRWVWEDGYGWTWIAAEPWGWAPYHYGSWYHSPNYGWCWYPPHPRVFSPWRPALVAFIGFGAGAGLSLGFSGGATFGNIGWVPLAPFEPYHPWWGNRYGYAGNTAIVNNVTNITNVTNVTNVNVYRNVRENAVSSVTTQRFLQGNFRRNTPVGAAQLGQAQVFHSALPVVPTASNLRFANAAVPETTAGHRALVQRSFAGNAQIVRRTAFADQRVAYANVTHAPITPLHFKDVRSTPLEAGRADAERALAPAPAQLKTDAHPVPAYAAPAHAGPASNPWDRFNASRGTNPRRRYTTETPAAKPNAQTYPRPAPAAGTVRELPAASTYHAPAAAGTYRYPAVNGTNRAPERIDRPSASDNAQTRQHDRSARDDGERNASETFGTTQTEPRATGNTRARPIPTESREAHTHAAHPPAGEREHRL